MTGPGRFELLPHTADAKFRAHGATMDEAFAHVVEALAAIATDKAVGRKRTLDLTVSADDPQTLLFSFIDQVIYLIDTEGVLPATADVTIGRNTSGYTLVAVLHGDDAKKYGCNLKAATYSDMVAEEKDGVWTLQAVVDI